MKRHILILAGVSALTASALFSQASAEVVKLAATAQFVTEQPASEWRARLFLGAEVQNTAGEVVGDINDLVFDHSGRISTVVLGVGGFLGVGEKNVAVPFDTLTFSSGSGGARVITVALSKDALKQAPTFKATEKTTLDVVKDKAIEFGHNASEKAVQLKDQAVKKVEDMKKSEPAKQ